MPRTVQEYCHDTLDFFIAGGLLGDYNRSGRFRSPKVRNPLIPMEQWELLHYSSCEGALYENASDWEIAFRLVNSFTRRGQRDGTSQIYLPRALGEFPGVRAEDLMNHLPVAFSFLGFHCQQNNTVTHDSLFVISGNVKIMKLPEPFGKWWQIREDTPRWSEEAQLELTVSAKIHETAQQNATLDLTMSTVALPLVNLIASQLMSQMQRPVRIPAAADLFNMLAEHNTRTNPWIRTLLGREQNKRNGAGTTPRHRTF